MSERTFDLNDKELRIGHIVAVRYVWNSYIGVVRAEGLHLNELSKRFASTTVYHAIRVNATYQILGHVDREHPDFNQDLLDWAKSEDSSVSCPIQLRIYDQEEGTAHKA